MADIRTVLHGLADEVGQITAPPDLASRGRRRLRRRRFAAIGTAGLAAAAIGAGLLLVPQRTTTTKPTPPADGTAAELVKGHWTIGDRPAPDRVYGAELTWTGNEVIALGGRKDDATVIRNYAWSPATREWRAIADAPSIIGTGHGASVWTGSRLLVMPGYSSAKAPEPDRALVYDPQKDSWAETSSLAAKVTSYGASAIWTGSQVLVAGALDGSLRVQSYDLAADRWTEDSPATPTHHEVSQAVAVETPDGPLVWSFWAHSVPNPDGSTSGFSGIDVYRREAGQWKDITTEWPKGVWSYYPFMAGDQLELGSSDIWCPACHGPARPGRAPVLVNLQDLTITDLPKSSVEDQRPPRVWTGSAEVVVDDFGTAAVRDPGSGWTDLPKAPTYLSYSSPVWTGRELVTETFDGRIATFGSLAPPTLPGCPEQLKAQKGSFDAGARVDTDGITSARMCTYTLADRTGLVYDHPQTHDATEDEVSGLREALAGLIPLDPAGVDCLGPLSPTATAIYVLRNGQVEAFSKSRSACAPWIGQGHDFSSSKELMTALDAIVG